MFSSASAEIIERVRTLVAPRFQVVHAGAYDYRISQVGPKTRGRGYRSANPLKESLESRIQAFGLQEKIGRVLIPTEAVTEVRSGKKYTSDRMFFPGYVLVEMDLTGFRTGGEGDHVWHVVKSTPKVTGFVGTANDPTPLSEDEVNQIVYRVAVGKDKPRLKIKFEKDESVRITDGPFANFTGKIDEVNEDRETLKVMVTIFGRATPVELEFGQVEKVA